MSTGTQTPTQRSRFSLRFSARDLLSVAIFAVIFIVVSYVIGLLGVVSPLTWLLLVPVQVITGGITFMLFLTRVKHAGMVTLFAVVVGLFYLISGNTPFSTLGILVLGVIAELLMWAGRYRSRWSAIWAYTVFGLGFFTPFLPMFIDREAYFSSATWAEMGKAYVSASESILTPTVLGLLGLAVLVCGFLGGLLGSAILRKHFVRAGLA